MLINRLYSSVLRQMFLLILISAILTPHSGTFTVAAASSGISKLAVGDYVEFGSYLGAKIIWRVIQKTADGNPLLLADRVITVKAFDSAGAYHFSDEDRFDLGSNYYPDSNLRQWLNSSSPNNGTARINWLQNEPSADHVLFGQFPYEAEKGFLADGNFTAAERAYIQPFTHRVALTEIDKSKRNGGSALLTNETSLADVVQNYESAYYRTLTDSVFLLSVKQLKEWVYDQRSLLGETFSQAYPTAELVAFANAEDEPFLSTEEPCDYWLNTPDTETSDSAKVVSVDGFVDSIAASAGGIGVRPAVVLDANQFSLVSGRSGTVNSPYVLSGVAVIVADNQPPTAPTGVQVKWLSATQLRVNWTVATDNVAVSQYLIYLNGKLITERTAAVTNADLRSLPAGVHTVQVAATDAAGNLSKRSAAVKAPSRVQMVNRMLLVNGKQVVLPAGMNLTQLSGVTMVPFAPYMQALGMKTTWSPKSKTLVATSADRTISIVLTVGKKQFKRNYGGNVSAPMLPIAPVLQGQMMLVPVRATAQTLNVSFFSK